MSKEKYRELIDQVRGKLGIENSKPQHEACGLQINEIAFTLLHGGEVDEDSLYIYCDFGSPSADQKALVSPRLIQTTLNFFGNSTPSFGLNAETGRAALMNRVALSQTTLGSLMSVLVKVASYVQMWRQHSALAPSRIEAVVDVQPAPLLAH
jgi:hypothetical protein